MERQQLQRCPVGIQTFSKLREEDYLYVDKTDLIYQLTHGASQYVFLSRPRRFGKSLLVSTLEAYFQGRKELFKGLAMERLEREWTCYPVLRFDMSLGKHMEKATLERYLGDQLSTYEQMYRIEQSAIDSNIRLKRLIQTAYQQTGRQVVVLIDEYDAPLLDVVHEERDLKALRHVMRNFYSPLKACDPYLRFVFLTGITKFSQLSIFSELNNIKNISMDDTYAALCGITQEELLTTLSPYIDRFAEKLNISREETISMLKQKYDGYHFCWPSPDVYNPFSLLNAFVDSKFIDYWFGSGTPTYLIEMLRKYHTLPTQIGGMWMRASSFDAPTEQMENIAPLLYQSGYLTIKDYNPYAQLYLLDIPNSEIRTGLMESLLPSYLHRQTDAGLTTIGLMYDAIRQEKMDEALRLMQTFLSTVPYADNTHYEGHYQQVLYILFSLFGMYVDVEVRTPNGRVDVVMQTKSTLYLIELKLNKSAEAAMAQIDLKDYPSRFALSGLPIVKVGINFDGERHTLKDWLIERM